MFVAPRDLAKNCIALIDRELRATPGVESPLSSSPKSTRSVDPPIIQALYRRFQAGVEIDLIVRGQCALVPGLRGISSHIRVRSISAGFSSTVVSSTSKMAVNRKSIWAARTGWQRNL